MRTIESLNMQTKNTHNLMYTSFCEYVRTERRSSESERHYAGRLLGLQCQLMPLQTTL